MHTAEAVAEISEYEQERGKPMPSENHAFVQTRLLLAFAVNKEFSVLSELTLELPTGQRLTPDISVYPQRKPNWSNDTFRMKTMPRQVVEIILPAQGTQEVIDKLDVYFAHGIESAWVVQPTFRTVAIYHLDARQPQVLVAGEAVDPATGLKGAVGRNLCLTGQSQPAQCTADPHFVAPALSAGGGPISADAWRLAMKSPFVPEDCALPFSAPPRRTAKPCGDV